MKAIRLNNGIIHLAESKAVCPFCDRLIPFDEVDDKLHASKDGHIRHKCECKRFIGITSDFRGDIRAYKLNDK